MSMTEIEFLNRSVPEWRLQELEARYQNVEANKNGLAYAVPELVRKIREYREVMPVVTQENELLKKVLRAINIDDLDPMFKSTADVLAAIATYAASKTK